MASSEPTLVPEWLRCNGHVNNGSTTAHHFASANSHSDASLLANSARNRSSRKNTDIGSPHAILDRSTSINARRNSSNYGSSKNPYSSFSRSHRDKEREKEKERLAFGDLMEQDSFEPLGKDPRRTQSMVSRRQGDSFSHSDASDFRKNEIKKDFLRNGVAMSDKHSSIVTKVSFDKDFPSLGADEKRVPNLVRVASPGLTTVSQGLPIGNKAMIGEGWSALAEVPVVIGSNSNSQSIHQPLASSAASVVSSNTSGVPNIVSDSLNTTSGDSSTASGTPSTYSISGPSGALNMAEALIQPPPATCTASQLSVETQRLEQLALQKVKLLIPMTPAIPKVLNSADKFKSKLNARFSETNGGNRTGMQPPPSSVSAICRSPRSGPVTLDASMQSHGNKLFVLKPTWENASVTPKDGPNPVNLASGKQTKSTLPAPAVSSNPARSLNSVTASVVERRSVFSSLTLASSVEKRSLSSYAKSRSDFFNSVRKKTSMTAVESETSDSNQCDIPPASPREAENGVSTLKKDSSDKYHNLSVTEKNSISCPGVIPVEEEVAFLRSLGWQEDDDEEGALTEEEINSFYLGARKLKPSLDLSQPALSILMESHGSK